MSSVPIMPANSDPPRLLDSEVTKPPIPELWEEIPAIRDAAARAGMIGLALADFLKEYQDRYDEALGFLKTRATLQDAAATSEITRLKEELSVLERSQANLAQERTDLQAELAQSAADERNKVERVRGARRTLIAKRFLFRNRREAEADDHRRSRHLTEIEHQKRLAQAKVATEIEDRNLNADAVERATIDASREIEAAAALLDEARRHSHALQLRGLTRQVGRFLVWASFFSFAGLGLLLSELIAGRLRGQDASQTPLAQFKQLLMGGAGSRQGLLVAFAEYAALITAMVLFIALFTVAVFVLLAKLDPAWAQKRRSRSTGSSPVAGIQSWFSFFSFTSPSVSKPPQSVDRRALIQILASIPLAVTAGVVGFFWIVSASSSPSAGNAPDPLKAVYIGLFYSVLASSSGLLCWLFVLRPAVEGQGVARVAKMFYGILFGLPAATLLVIALLPNRGNSIAISLAGMAAIAATIGLGHGLYLNGIFAREDYLDRNLARLREALGVLEKQPTAHDHIEDLSAEGIRRTLRELVPGGTREKRPFWKMFHRVPAKSKPEDTDDGPLRSLIEAAEVPAELVEQLNTATADAATAQTVRLSLEGKLGEMGRRLGDYTDQIPKLRDRIDRLRKFRLEVMDAHESVRLRLLVDYQRVCGAITEAHALGFASRNGRPLKAPPEDRPKSKSASAGGGQS